MDDHTQSRWRARGIVLVLAALLAACGPAPSPTPPAATTATTPGGGATPSTNQSLNQITFVFFPTSGSLDTPSHNNAIWTGVQRGAQAIGAQATNFAIKNLVDLGADIDQLIADGTDVVIANGNSTQPILIAAARKYPATYFIGLEHDPPEAKNILPNYASLAFAEDQAGFLAGALAAQLTHTRKVSAIIGSSAVSSSWRFGEGYRAGVHYIDPAITVQIEYHDDVDLGRAYSDPVWGQARAQSQLANGSDVLFAVAGATGTSALGAVAAYQRQSGQRVLAIGADIDQYDVLPEAQAVLVSSALKATGPRAAQIIASIAAGTFRGGTHTGEVGLAPFHDLAGQVPAAVQTRLQQITRSLNDGTLQTHVPPSKNTAP